MPVTKWMVSESEKERFLEERSLLFIDPRWGFKSYRIEDLSGYFQRIKRFLTDDPERAHCSLRWTAPDSLDKGKDVSFETMVWTTTGGYLA